jgi:hypothetical protein
MWVKCTLIDKKVCSYEIAEWASAFVDEFLDSLQNLSTFGLVAITCRARLPFEGGEGCPNLLYA